MTQLTLFDLDQYLENWTARFDADTMDALANLSAMNWREELHRRNHPHITYKDVRRGEC